MVGWRQVLFLLCQCFAFSGILAMPFGSLRLSANHSCWFCCLLVHRARDPLCRTSKRVLSSSSPCRCNPQPFARVRVVAASECSNTGLVLRTCCVIEVEQECGRLIDLSYPHRSRAPTTFPTFSSRTCFLAAWSPLMPTSPRRLASRPRRITRKVRFGSCLPCSCSAVRCFSIRACASHCLCEFSRRPVCLFLT